MRSPSEVPPERLVGAGVAIGVVLATAMIGLAGFVGPTVGILTGLLYVLAWLVPIAGGLFALGAIMWAVDPDRQPAERLGPHRAGDGSDDERTVGTSTASRLSRSAEARYDCMAAEDARAIRQHLADGAVRVVRNRRGFDWRRAGEAVRTGSWTDDPVAAAFLGDDSRYPVGEWARGVVDPAAAYRRRVRRTTRAIERLDRGTYSGEHAREGRS